MLSIWRVLAVTALVVAYAIRTLLADSPVTPVDRVWGPRADDGSIIDFSVPYVQAEVDDLELRLGRYRAGSFMQEHSADWSYGTNHSFLNSALQYWQHNYSWEAAVARLNRVPQYTTVLAGLRVHFWHIPAASPEAPVVLCLHGWPGSVFEFHKVARLLAGKVTLVVPSLPGYGWSEAATVSGLGPIETGCILQQLMSRLGYNKYVIQGGDWGSIVAQGMSRTAPEQLAGLHLNFFQAEGLRALLGTPALLFSDASERSKLFPLSQFVKNVLQTTGYLHHQATTPHTVGVALDDSPAGLASWILEKFARWSDCPVPCDPSEVVSMDELLTNLMIYWSTRSGTSSVRYYKEAIDSAAFWAMSSGAIRVPTGLIEFPREILPPPRAWVAWRYTDLVSYTKAHKGGHFAALEQPEVLAADLQKFLKLVWN